MKAPPIIFLHKGSPDFLKIILKKAIETNPNSEVFLLGDDSNSHLTFINHFYIDSFFKSAQDFEKKFYIHMSKNNYQFELICYQRWFILEEFIKSRDIKSFWYVDSDVLIIEDLYQIFKKFKGEKFDLIGHDVMNGGNSDSFMPCLNYYRSSLISLITNYIKASYKEKETLKILDEKWNRHIENNLPGGVCDMTQLKMFFQKNSSSINTYNLYNPNNEYVIDGNINSNLNYFGDDKITFKKRLGLKLINIKNKKAFGILSNGRKVKFISLHFQGKIAKNTIKYHTKDNFNHASLFGTKTIFLNYWLKKRVKKAYGKFLKIIK